MTSSFGFVSGRGTTDARLSLWSTNRQLYMTFMDLEKAFDCVPQNILGLRVKCKKDQGHDLRHRPGPPAEFI